MTIAQHNTRTQYIYSLQDAASDILGASHPVSSCLKRVVGAGVEVIHDGNHAHYGNLATCQRPWLCPVCSRRLLSARRLEIEAVLKAAHEAGKDAIFVTCTIQHNLNSRLDGLLDAMLAGWRSVFSGDRTGKRAVLVRVTDQVKAVEIRYGRTAGWHPHLHVLVIVDHADLTPTEAALLDEGIAETIYSRYAAAVERKGYTAARGAFNSQQVKDLAGAVSTYIQKFEIGLELTEGQQKEGRSYSVFQLLALAAAGETQIFGKSIKDLFLEYADATLKRRQISFSRGIAKSFKPEELVTEEPAKEEVVLATISRAVWNVVLRLKLRAVVLDVADAGDADQLRVYLDGLERMNFHEEG